MKKTQYKNVLLAGAISLIIATGFYFLNQKKRKPLYTFKDNPSLIYNKETGSSVIKLIKFDSILITENVYSTKLILWNDGELPILKEDIRKKFYISLVGKGEILEAKIIKETHPEISNFKLTKLEELIKIEWEYFDPNFGVEIQFLYSGNNKSCIEIDGLILGDNVTKVTNGNTLTIKNIVSVVLVNIVVFLALLFEAMTRYDGSNDDDESWSFFDYFITIVMLSTILISIIYIVVKAWGYRPPL